jgi:hypothetical protein
MSVAYWYVEYDDDRPWDFFCDEESLTEAEWRQRAPADKVAELDQARRGFGAELFPKDIAAS